MQIRGTGREPLADELEGVAGKTIRSRVLIFIEVRGEEKGGGKLEPYINKRG